MITKLIKKLTLGVALTATALSFGQIDVNFTDPGTIKLNPTDGSLSGGTISFTVSKIPENTAKGFQIRVYDKKDGSYNRPGFPLFLAGIPLNSTTADGDKGNFSITTVANATPGFIDRTYTITNVPAATVAPVAIVEGTPYIITLRFDQLGPAGTNAIPGGFDTTGEGIPAGAVTSGGKHFIYILHTLDSTLSLSKVNAIEGAVINASNGSINVTGAKLDAVYSITGQQVRATNLTNGIYIVKVSKGNKISTVKVSLD